MHEPVSLTIHLEEHTLAYMAAFYLIVQKRSFHLFSIVS